MIPKKFFRHLLEYCAAWILAGIIRALPASLAIRLGRFLGVVTGRLIKSRMQLGHENLIRAFGDQFSHEDRCRILRSLMALLGEALVESIIITPEDVEKNVEVQGFHHIEEALSLGRGVILMGPHFGMWELAGHIFGARLPRTATLYKPLEKPFYRPSCARGTCKKQYGYYSQSEYAQGHNAPAPGKLRGCFFV